MPNPKAGGIEWTSDIRSENIETVTETNGTETAEYKVVDAHPIIGGILDKLAFFRTHASAVWYNKLKNITVLQQLDNLASNIGTLSQLLTTDKDSLVGAVNELKNNIRIKIYDGAENLGLSPTSATIDDLVNAMPDHSVLYDYANATNRYVGKVPTSTGSLAITRIVGSRVYITYTSVSGTMYYAEMSAGHPTGEWFKVTSTKT